MTTLLHSRHCSTRTCALAVLVCSLAWSAAPTTVHAVPTFSAEIPGVERVIDSPTPVFLSNRIETVDRGGAGNVVIGQATRQAIAAASYGQLRASSDADYLNVSDGFPIFSGSGTFAQAGSDFILDDLVITGPPGNILVSFNFVITGSIGASTESTGPTEFYRSTAGVTAEAAIGGAFGGAGSSLGAMSVDAVGGNLNVTRTGIFSTFPVNSDGMAVGTSASIMTFAGDDSLQFFLSLDTGAIASVGVGAGPGRTHGFAAGTFGLPTSGPVANLPEGYTLNSLDGRIVNNRFVVPEQVPEPSSLVLVLVAAGVLILRKRHSP